MPIVRQREQLDVGSEREHGPCRLRKNGRRNLVGSGQESIASGHLFGREQLDPTEKLLMLELLLAETHEREDGILIAETVAPRELEHLGVDVPLDETEDVGVGPSLHPTGEATLAFGQEFERRYERKTVGEELDVARERTSSNHIAVDVPAHLLGGG